jgi:YgiT-type zinc finger domain-containing protein
MKCSIQGCPGEYERQEIAHVVRQGDRLMVIDHVPVEICSICGDVLFTPATVRQLETLRHTTASPSRTVPLYDFTETRSA